MTNPGVPYRIPFWGRFYHATNASALDEATSRYVLYYRDPATGAATAITLGANDTLEILSMTIVASAALLLQVYDGADAAVDAGEQIAAQRTVATQLYAHQNLTPGHVTKAGTYPKFKASGAGEVESYIRGFWRKESS